MKTELELRKEAIEITEDIGDPTIYWTEREFCCEESYSMVFDLVGVDIDGNKYTAKQELDTAGEEWGDIEDIEPMYDMKFKTQNQ